MIYSLKLRGLLLWMRTLIMYYMYCSSYWIINNEVSWYFDVLIFLGLFCSYTTSIVLGSLILLFLQSDHVPLFLQSSRPKEIRSSLRFKPLTSLANAWCVNPQDHGVMLNYWMLLFLPNSVYIHCPEKKGHCCSYSTD